MKPGATKKTAALLIGNEILLGAAKKVLQGMGYKVRTDIESCAEADFAVIGSYFLLLGVVNQVRSKNPLLPLVLIDVANAALNGYSKYFYGAINLDGSSEMDAVEKIENWFRDGQGKFLIDNGRHEMKKIGATDRAILQGEVLEHLEKSGPATLAELTRTLGRPVETVKAIVYGLDSCGFVRVTKHEDEVTVERTNKNFDPQASVDSSEVWGG